MLAGAGIAQLICAECKYKVEQLVQASLKARRGFNLVIAISLSTVQYASFFHVPELIFGRHHAS